MASQQGVQDKLHAIVYTSLHYTAIMDLMARQPVGSPILSSIAVPPDQRTS